MLPEFKSAPQTFARSKVCDMQRSNLRQKKLQLQGCCVQKVEAKVETTAQVTACEFIESLLLKADVTMVCGVLVQDRMQVQTRVLDLDGINSKQESEGFTKELLVMSGPETCAEGTAVNIKNIRTMQLQVNSRPKTVVLSHVTIENTALLTGNDIKLENVETSMLILSAEPTQCKISSGFIDSLKGSVENMSILTSSLKHTELSCDSFVLAGETDIQQELVLKVNKLEIKTAKVGSAWICPKGSKASATATIEGFSTELTFKIDEFNKISISECCGFKGEVTLKCHTFDAMKLCRFDQNVSIDCERCEMENPEFSASLTLRSHDGFIHGARVSNRCSLFVSGSLSLSDCQLNGAVKSFGKQGLLKLENSKCRSFHLEGSEVEINGADTSERSWISAASKVHIRKCLISDEVAVSARVVSIDGEISFIKSLRIDCASELHIGSLKVDSSLQVTSSGRIRVNSGITAASFLIRSESELPDFGAAKDCQFDELQIDCPSFDKENLVRFINAKTFECVRNVLKIKTRKPIKLSGNEFRERELALKFGITLAAPSISFRNICVASLKQICLIAESGGIDLQEYTIQAKQITLDEKTQGMRNNGRYTEHLGFEGSITTKATSPFASISSAYTRHNEAFSLSSPTQMNPKTTQASLAKELEERLLTPWELNALTNVEERISNDPRFSETAVEFHETPEPISSLTEAAKSPTEAPQPFSSLTEAAKSLTEAPEPSSSIDFSSDAATACKFLPVSAKESDQEWWQFDSECRSIKAEIQAKLEAVPSQINCDFEVPDYKNTEQQLKLLVDKATTDFNREFEAPQRTLDGHQSWRDFDNSCSVCTRSDPEDFHEARKAMQSCITDCRDILPVSIREKLPDQLPQEPESYINRVHPLIRVSQFRVTIGPSRVTEIDGKIELANFCSAGTTPRPAFLRPVDRQPEYKAKEFNIRVPDYYSHHYWDLK
ncbi:hypothetical protein BOX15_Mlig022560g1 [Macrostomum lignano]|uniref:Uncharacterized protein n=1 Tax=Macrostomum lignano TaxID=282301 RepID=A0A267E360_9PLAT|nr:hypothetical protein BOX15_Mlig022560g1 [Macrostomum lignano]